MRIIPLAAGAASVVAGSCAAIVANAVPSSNGRKQVVEDKTNTEVNASRAGNESGGTVTDNDNDPIINLNVGGKTFTTRKSTLCQVEGSLFATMFSGRWEDSVERDQDGTVFFDFNPNHFGVILNYLRVKKIATSENPVSLFKISEDEANNFNILVEYLGLSDEIVPTEIFPDEKFNLHSPGVTLEEDGKVAVHDGTDGLEYALGENVYKQGIVNLEFKLKSFENLRWVFVGIMDVDVFVPPNNVSHEWLSGYGWTLGVNGGSG
ncbi:uncharacterized protein LOC114533673 [Dendronephthya gigantea]|uniref:uncharacterized protein LOC114533673 n=1 Tax=Dendronephthya gigantea TaxID=151771 RepID=UPI00106C8F44|nr:uncharacterized protein LOC114533673 [Dendronephthya gigantea]